MPWLPIDRIYPDKNQPRKIFSIKHIEGLAASIKQEGFINEIEVSQVDDKFMIITGECRFKAAQLLNWKKVPVRINSTEYSEYERLRHQLAENVHQSGEGIPMNPIDVAESYAKLISLKIGKDYHPGGTSREETYGLIKPMAQEIGVDYETIWEHLQLLEEPEFVQKALRDGLPRTYIREAELAPLEVQGDLKKKIVAGDYPSRESITQDVQILKRLPDLGLIELERQKSKENIATNRILNGVARLGLALEALPLEQINIEEKQIIVKQLKWVQQKIQEYIQ